MSKGGFGELRPRRHLRPRGGCRSRKGRSEPLSSHIVGIFGPPSPPSRSGAGRAGRRFQAARAGSQLGMPARRSVAPGRTKTYPRAARTCQRLSRATRSEGIGPETSCLNLVDASLHVVEPGGAHRELLEGARRPAVGCDLLADGVKGVHHGLDDRRPSQGSAWRRVGKAEPLERLEGHSRV
jgi:hypothetical protein